MCTCAHFCYKMVHCGIRYYLDHTLNSKKIYHNSKCQNLPSQVSYGYLSLVFCKTLIMYQQDGAAVIEQKNITSHSFCLPFLATCLCCDLFHCGYSINSCGLMWCIYPYSSGLLHWLMGQLYGCCSTTKFTLNDMDKTDHYYITRQYASHAYILECNMRMTRQKLFSALLGHYGRIHCSLVDSPHKGPVM